MCGMQSTQIWGLYARVALLRPSAVSMQVTMAAPAVVSLDARAWHLEWQPP